MAHSMSDVSTAVSETAEKVMDRFGSRKRTGMLSERWPMIALMAVLVAGITAGIAFGIVQRHSMDMQDMNSEMDEMFGGEHADDPAI